MVQRYISHSIPNTLHYSSEIHPYVGEFSYLCVIKQRILKEVDKPMTRIKEVLEEKGIKQTWLVEKLGKSFSIVNSYVCNRRQPSLETLFQIVEILGVKTRDLIE